MTQDELKQAVAKAALAYIKPKLENDTVLGIEGKRDAPRQQHGCAER